MSKWNAGPPPSVGWWPASVGRHPEALRWWDGRKWSRVAWKDQSAEAAAIRAATYIGTKEQVKWQHRPESWPARSKT